MSQTIDKRIVEMAFENSQFEGKVGQTMSTVDKLKKSLNFDGAGKGFDNISAAAGRVSFNPISDALSRLTGGFSALSIIGVTTLVRLTNAAITAGEQFAKSLIIDPIKTGLNEYETKLNSVQTILANTQKEGTDLATVTKALNELNTYSDKTIYNFQQMTRNVGTFTAAGVKLDTSVAAIKGIANLAAISGSNADQASTAMYQLSQALSTGTVKLMDWNSVVNAGMGGQVFQDAIIETARLHGVAIDQMIKDEGSFRATLEKGWFTSDILTETLQKFTGDLNEDQLRTMGYTEDQIKGIIKMGQTANDAATKVKTFTQLFSTLREAAQSGWAQTWEIIIGDFNEAKSFLTELNDWMGGIIGASAAARNNLLQGWKDMGGRTKLLEAFKNVLTAIVTVVNPIREAMRDIFPPATAQNLLKITEAVAAFTKRLILTAKGAQNVKRLFRGVFAIFDIGKMAVVAIAKEFGRLLGYLTPVGGGLSDLAARFGDFLVKVRDFIKANDVFGKILRVIGNAILVVAAVVGKVVEAIGNAIKKFTQLEGTEGFFKAFAKAVETFFASFKNADLSVLKGFVDKVKERFAPLAKLGDFFKTGFAGVSKSANPFVQRLGEIGEHIREALGKFVLNVLDKIAKIDFSKITFNKTFDSLNKGLLAALLLSVTQFVRKGTGIFGSIIDVFKGIKGFSENAAGILSSITTIMTGVKDILTAWQQQIRAGILLKIASAIAILSVSLIALSLVDSKKLSVALAAVTGLFVDLFGAMAVYEKTVGGGMGGIGGMAKGIISMLGLASAVLILSGALVNVSQLKSEDIVKGITAIATLTATMVATSIILSKNDVSVAKGAIGIIAFSLAIRALIKPVKSLADMDTGALVRGLAGLGAMLAEISIFMKTMNFKTTDLDDLIGILVLSGAIQSLSNVIKQMGALDSNVLTKGLAAIGVLMAGMSAFARITTVGGAFILTAGAMLVMSGAMTILADVVKKFAGLSVEQLVTGLAGLGGSLAIFAVALNAMTGGIAGAAALVVAAGAMVLLVPPMKALGSMDIKAIGLALLAMAGAFTVLGVAASVLTPLLPSILLLGVGIAALGVAALAAGAGVLAFSAGMAALAISGAAGGAALAAILLTLSTIVPTLATAAAKSIVAFAKEIQKGAPVIFKTGQTLIVGFISSLTSTLPQIVELMVGYITKMLEAVANQAPQIVAAGTKLVMTFLNGMKGNIGQLTTTVVDIINGFLAAIALKMPEISDSGWNLIKAWIDSMKTSVDEHLPELMDSVRELGWSIVKGVIKGIVEGQGDSKDAASQIGQTLIDGFKESLGIHSPSTVFTALAGEIINGLILGIVNNVKTVYNKVSEMGNQIVLSLRGKYDSMVSAGKDLVTGFVQGISSYISTAVSKAASLASQVITAIRNTLQEHSPSKLTTESGKNVTLGLAEGIVKYAGEAVKAAKDVSKQVVAGFGQISSQNFDKLLTADPTIRPVLDLTEIAKGATTMNQLLQTTPLNVGLAVDKTSAIATNIVKKPLIDESQLVPQASTNAPQVQFVQNNYSPAELSRIEIYRQTRNQLLQAKGVLAS